MTEILKILIPFLVSAIGGLIFFVLLREGIHAYKVRRSRKSKERCQTLVGNLEDVKTEDLLPLALELKKLFPADIILDVLDQAVARDSRLATLYDHLGFVEQCLIALKEAKSWTDRAYAAESLGKMGHSRAVIPLIAVLKDPTEDKEVKSIAVRSLGKIKDERAIPSLIESLGSPDPSTDHPLADVLTSFGNVALDPLIETLKNSTEESRRFWSAKILGRIRNQRAVSSLLASLGDHSLKVRAEACLSLGILEAKEAIHPLTNLILQDPVAAVRDAAAAALGSIADEKALASLKETLSNLDETARGQAIQAIEKMGTKGIPFFMETLTASSRQASAEAASALERLGLVSEKIEGLSTTNWAEAFAFLLLIAKAGVVETLSRSLKHPLLPVRIFLCRILAEAKNQRTLEALTDLARDDPEWVVRLEALFALMKLANPISSDLFSEALAKEETPFLEKLLNGLETAPFSFVELIKDDIVPCLQQGNIVIRTQAIRVLARVGSEKEICPLIMACLSDAAGEVRKEAAEALGKIVQEAKEYGPQIRDALLKALADVDIEVRLAGVRSLAELKDPQTIIPLAESFEWAGERARDEIANALALMPIQNIYQLADVLMGLSEPRSRAGVAWTLGLLKDEKAVRLALTFLKDPDPLVRAAAAGGVGNYCEREAQALDDASRFTLHVSRELLPYLADPNEHVRAAVVNALGKTLDASVIDSLLHLLTNDPDLFVCQRTALAMACLINKNSDRELQSKVTTSIKQWIGASEQPENKAAGWIALALLRDESSFSQILMAVEQEPYHEKIQHVLNNLPKKMQEDFFSFLSLDAALFWKKRQSSSHYISLLQFSRDPGKRVKAVQALGILKETSSLPLIEQAFAKDPDARVRAQALATLGFFLKGKELLTKVIKAVHDPSDLVRMQVIPILGLLAPRELEESKEDLILLLDSSVDKVREMTCELLARLYRRDWQCLADHMMGTEKQGRILGLIDILAEIADPEMGPLFMHFMKHENARVRAKSAKAAARTSILSKKDWIPYLADPQEEIRAAAIDGLGQEIDQEVLAVFERHLEDPSVIIRKKIAHLLGQKAVPEEARATAILKLLIKDENVGVQLVSVVSLFRRGVAGQASEIEKILGQMDSKERDDVLLEFQKEGVFIELLTTLRHSQAASRRKDALEILAAMNLEEYTKDIALPLQDPASEVRLACVEILGQLKEPEIQEAVEALSQDPVEAVRLAVKRRKLRTVK